jgi:hypothetical protein
MGADFPRRSQAHAGPRMWRIGGISVRAYFACHQTKSEINVPKGIDKIGVLWFHSYR